MGANVTTFEHKYGHIFPSVVPHSIPCRDWTPYATKNCGNIDTAHKLLSHVHPSPVLKPMAVNWGKYGKFYKVNTKPFFLESQYDNIESIGEKAKLFIPHKCLKGGCHLHVFLHGCT
jgi:hypothetical protein